eukprot:TRINITY_DN14346_c1_g1_i1.p1 TRINITY_DN14346_c1_g1~~TRINITY_DN14346_c1_g1_i1.p1  ORF type:complete len:300 (-),score=49.16 TRINITY_DN14346_c1_g1_i1:305-1153(-)
MAFFGSQSSGFSDRVALVTGGGSGIGRAVALAFAREGACVVVADINLKLAAETVALARDFSDKVLPYQCDVSVIEEVENMVKFAVSEFGALHHCFNNAGIEGSRARLHEMDPKKYVEVMSTNAGGVFNCMSLQIRQMLSQLSNDEHGQLEVDDSPYSPKKVDKAGLTIVNTSSTAGLAAMPEFSPYCASKHAVIGLTKSAAKEYAADGIRINCICPSTTATSMVERFSEQWPDWQAKQNASFPIQRVSTPEEIAESVLFLSSPTACNAICGTCLTIDGGLSC